MPPLFTQLKTRYASAECGLSTDRRSLSDQITLIQVVEDRLNEIYHQLHKDNFPVGMIHGNLQTNEREQIMNQFRQGDIRILLSTDLLSRGIDIQQLSLVINYDLPMRPETYIHRVGRAARAGRSGNSYTFLKPSQIG